MKSIKKKSCFVIGPIGKKGSDIRKKADQLLKHVIAPAVLKCGYAKPVRADNIGEPGIITSQIIDHVINDDLVVADLTGNNPNVFYELAIRHVARKQVVNLVEEGQEIAFDVNEFRAISYDLTDPDSVKYAIEELRAHIKGGEKHAVIENPIANAIDLLSLRSSQNPIETALARMQEQIQELHRFAFIKAGHVEVIRGKGPIASVASPSIKEVIYPPRHYSQGMTIRHKTFGDGIIVFVEGNDENAKLTIKFPVGIKKIMSRYVPLEIVAKGSSS